MIDENAISKFPRETQQKIRDKLERMMKLGHKRNHLQLLFDGTICLDYEAIEDDALGQAFKTLELKMKV